MAEVAQVWQNVLPTVKNGVTGVGVWTALNSCVAVSLEDGTLVLGLPHRDGELAGHLRIPQTQQLIESVVSRELGQPIKVRVIEGTTAQDWENVKRRDEEARRLQEAAYQKAREQMEARSAWDSLYEKLGRMYAGVGNKSLPQNRAKFFAEATKLLAEARQSHSGRDDLSERNFARCIERVAQYTEIPSGMIAVAVLQQTGEI
ncbi:MAG: hypothetical protein SNJ74_10105 [Fimbriimonadaceae bacterium]